MESSRAGQEVEYNLKDTLIGSVLVASGFLLVLPSFVMLGEAFPEAILINPRKFSLDKLAFGVIATLGLILLFTIGYYVRSRQYHPLLRFFAGTLYVPGAIGILGILLAMLLWNF